MVTPFKASGPPPNSGLHRYAFLLFRQKPRSLLASNPRRRSRFDVRAFAHTKDLQLVAFTFYETQRKTSE